MCSNDVEQLKELQVDLTAQHHIAADLLSEVCKRFKFPYQRQCVLNTVCIVAATIRNLQKLEQVLTERKEFSEKELHNLHVAVEGHVRCVKSELRPWLSNVLPTTIGSTGHSADIELQVSL